MTEDLSYVWGGKKRKEKCEDNRRDEQKKGGGVGDRAVPRRVLVTYDKNKTGGRKPITANRPASFFFAGPSRFLGRVVKRGQLL